MPLLEDGPLKCLKHPLALVLLVPTVFSWLMIAFLANVPGVKSPQLGFSVPREVQETLRNGKDYQKVQALSGLDKYGKSAAPYLLEALKDPDENKRISAIQPLIRLKDPDSIPKIIELASSDPVPNVRSNALYALSRTQDDRALACLAKSLRQDLDAVVRRSAAQSLVHVKKPGMIPVLKEALGTETDDAVKINLCRALAEAGDGSVYEMALKGMESGDPLVRMEAADTLGMLGRPEALPALERHLNDEQLVASEAKLAKAKIEYKGKAYPANVEYLKNALDKVWTERDSSPAMSIWAVKELGKLDCPEAVQLLKEQAEQHNDRLAMGLLKRKNVFWIDPDLDRYKITSAFFWGYLFLLSWIVKNKIWFWFIMVLLSALFYGVYKVYQSGNLAFKIMLSILLLALAIGTILLFLGHISYLKAI